MKGIISFKELKELIKSEKAVKVILIVGAVLIMIIVFGGIMGGSKSENTDIYSRKELSNYEHSLENRLSTVLSEIDGIGRLNVMVTLDTSEINEYGKSRDMLLSVKSPYVRGVVVVCDGGDNVLVREKVISAVSGVFGISTARISVIK